MTGVTLMNVKTVNILGMELEEIKHKSCTAHFGVDKDFATLYDIKSKEQGKGHASELLKNAKEYYEKQGLRFGGSVALNSRIKAIYKKLNIKECE